MLKRKISVENVQPSSKTAKILPVSPPPSSFPSDVLKWMKGNAAPKMSLKLMQICKYFQFQEFPYFVIKNLLVNFRGCSCETIGNEKQKIDLENFSKKLWITRYFELASRNNLMSNLLTNIVVFDIRILDLNFPNIPFEQFKLLTSGRNVARIFLHNSVIKNDNDEAMPLEDIFECLPNVETFITRFNSNSFFSHQKAKKVIPQKLGSLNLRHITEPFNLKECFKFIENNQHIYFEFECHFLRSDEFKNQLEKCIDDLIQAWSPNYIYKPPRILFYGQSAEFKGKLATLRQIYDFNLHDQKF